MLALVALLANADAQNAFADLVSTHALTASDDYRIGSNYVELSGWLYGRVEDPVVVRRVEGVARRVIAASDRPDLVVNVIVADDPEVNASAYPGGFLVVNRGAVELFDDEELTFVLAHELSHVLLRHYATTENLRVAAETLSVAEKAMTASDRDQAESAALELQRMMARYGRQLEFEADLYGQLYTVRAGVPMAAAKRAMDKLAEAVGPIPEAAREIANHPTFPERVAELEQGAVALQKTHQQFDIGLSAMSAGLHEMAIEAFQEFLTLFPRSAAGWSNLAAAHLERGLVDAKDPWFDRVPVRVRNDVTLRASGSIHMDRSRDACGKALNVDPNLPECLVMLGVMARHSGRADEARTFLTRADSLSEAPDAAVAVNFGILEAEAGNADAALQWWAKAEAADPGNAQARANRAVLLEKKGDTDGAVAIWKALLDDGRMSGRASLALSRLTQKDVARPGGATAVRLGELELGLAPDAVKAVLGAPSIEQGDDIGLNVYMLWTGRGISALFSADAAVGYECWTPCDLDVRGVAVGKPYASVEALGPPSDIVNDPLYGPDRTSFWANLGLTVYEANGRVGRIALWMP